MSTALRLRPSTTIRIVTPVCALRWAMVGAALLAVVVAVATSLDRYAGPTPLVLANAAATAPSEARVVATDVRAEREVGFVTVTGSAARTGARSEGRLEAVVELLDEDGRLAGVGAALLPEAAAPGLGAPFSVALADSPRAAAFRVTFRTLAGQGVPASVEAHPAP